jgi:uncharacterized protein (DUF1330 family)
MSSIVPNAEQIQALLDDPDQGPVVMLNLLKFKERADGEEGTGADAYLRYGAAVVKMVQERGGQVLWSARASHVLIGSEADNWDAIALVQYPSPRAFLEMGMSSEYQKIHGHREAGLDRTVLIACHTIDPLESR